MKGIIGSRITFQKLFSNAQSAPIAVTTPTITIYYWDATGVKRTLLMITPLPVSTPSETGRYAYTYTIPTTLTEDVTLYAWMQGTDPGTGDLIAEEQVVDLDLWMAAEDFAWYTQEIPGCFYRIGTRNEAKGFVHGLHTPQFDVDEDALKTSTGLMAWMAIQ
jgi:hypothetical protein